MSAAPALPPDAADPVALAVALVRRRSLTPDDAGALAIAEGVLAPLGFTLRRMRFGAVENLYARRGTAGPHLMFARPRRRGARGRPRRLVVAALRRAGARRRARRAAGVADMKGAVAAWLAALARGPLPERGSLSVLLTADEEGPALDGTRRVVEALLAQGERVDACLVGEPTSAVALGDMMKTGRRGSLNATVAVQGVQGHVAYPDRARNPVPVLAALVGRLCAEPWGAPAPGFQPSNLEVTDLEVGNTADNLIPARAAARLNIRFNPAWTGATLTARLEALCDAASAEAGVPVRLEARVSGEAFHTPDGPFTDLVSDAVRAVTGRTPERSTTGGTSDARFLRALCPVVEFGLVGATHAQGRRGGAPRRCGGAGPGLRRSDRPVERLNTPEPVAQWLEVRPAVVRAT